VGEGEEENMIIEFNPDGLDEMLVAGIWSRWKSQAQPDLLSFAAILDDRERPFYAHARSLPCSTASADKSDPLLTLPCAAVQLSRTISDRASATSCTEIRGAHVNREVKTFIGQRTAQGRLAPFSKEFGFQELFSMAQEVAAQRVLVDFGPQLKQLSQTLIEDRKLDVLDQYNSLHNFWVSGPDLPSEANTHHGNVRDKAEALINTFQRRLQTLESACRTAFQAHHVPGCNSFRCNCQGNWSAREAAVRAYVDMAQFYMGVVLFFFHARACRNINSLKADVPAKEYADFLYNTTWGLYCLAAGVDAKTGVPERESLLHGLALEGDPDAEDFCSMLPERPTPADLKRAAYESTPVTEDSYMIEPAIPGREAIYGYRMCRHVVWRKRYNQEKRVAELLRSLLAQAEQIRGLGAELYRGVEWVPNQNLVSEVVERLGGISK
jgi:hypothetical protein